MKLSIFLILVAVAFEVTVNAKTHKVEKQHVSSKSSETSLPSAEEMFRRYQKAQKEVDELNKKFPTTSFAITKFSFMTEAERKSYYFKLPPLQKFPNFVQFDDENITAPDSYDYRDYNGVTPVKNQMVPNSCGSCYAFAATGAVESQFLIQQNLEIDLSEEYVLECDSVDAECKGGYPYHALNLFQSSGVPSEDCYPYTGLNGTCPIDIIDLFCDRYNISGYKSLGTDEDKYPGLIYKYGPAAIVMKAGDKLQQYDGTVLDFPIDECGSDGHAVLLVGYTEDYWIAKNSWGDDWSVDNGYFKFKRGINFCDFTSWSEPVIPYLN